MIPQECNFIAWLVVGGLRPFVASASERKSSYVQLYPAHPSPFRVLPNTGASVAVMRNGLLCALFAEDVSLGPEQQWSR